MFASPATAFSNLSLSIVGADTVPQGRRVVVEVTVDNPTSVDLMTSVLLRLVAPSGDSVLFDGWSGTVPPGGSETFQREVWSGQFFNGPGDYAVRINETPHEVGFNVVAAEVPRVRFMDVSEVVGPTTTHLAPIERCDNYAAGAAWGDIDGDGMLELFVPHESGPAQLFKWSSGGFVNQAAERGVTNDGVPGLGAVFVDHDGDGDQDLYVSNDGPNRLYVNDGAGHFVDAAPALGLDNDGATSSSAWADYDADGDLDVYVVNYYRCDDDGVIDDALMRNDGAAGFTDVSQQLPWSGDNDGLGFQAAWFDYDNDRDLDLYLANDHIRDFDQANFLWRNDGPSGDGGWTFANVSESSGAGVAMNTMGIAVGDYDNDGDLDLALSNMMESALLQNQGDGTFVDVANEVGVDRPEQSAGRMAVTWGLEFADLNNDGYLDLYVGAGELVSSARQPNAVFVNAGDGTFLDLSAGSGGTDPERTRGVAVADVDRDGRLDVFIMNQAGTPRLLWNQSEVADQHWLGLDLVGTTSPAQPCGARVEVTLTKGHTLIRELGCGSSGLATGSDSTIHVGLGSVDRVKSVTVRWPSGKVQKLNNVGADQWIVVVEK